MELLRLSSAGLYCERGGFHIDPWGPVSRAVITHAHGDHAVRGSANYFTAASGVGLLQLRMGTHARIQSVPFGEAIDINGVKVSLHPAGHILGSSQVRVECRGEVWVFSGDYLTLPNSSCEAFEPVSCHTFITESTFAHPFYRWPEPATIFARINDWWKANQAAGKASFLYCYALGKAQRLLTGLDPAIGPIYVQRDIDEINTRYRTAGIALPETRSPHQQLAVDDWSRGVFLMPPVSRWQQPFAFAGPFVAAFVSGWMLLPDAAHDRRVHAGFPLSDHADHAEIHRTIQATGAGTVYATHGYVEELVAEVQKLGLNGRALRTPHSKRPPRAPDSA